MLVCVWVERVVNITQLHTHHTHNDVGACVVLEVMYITHLHACESQWWAYVGVWGGWEGGEYCSITHTQYAQ